MTTTLHQASQQWMSRPADERFTSLIDMQAFKRRIRELSLQGDQQPRTRGRTPPRQRPRADGPAPDDDSFRADALVIRAAVLARQPRQLAGQLFPRDQHARPDDRRLPQLQSALHPRRRRRRHPPDQRTTSHELRSVNGPNYGRVYDADVVDALVDSFGDGVTGQWRVPGEFGKAVNVTKDNTTLYASDRDMFVFLADEENRIEIPNRRAGKFGSFARGFFVWNSEVGKTTLGAGFFLFDYVCCNRIVWGADQYTEVRIRHTKGAPDRWLEEVTPVLDEYSRASAKPVVEAIYPRTEKRLGDELDAFLANRFGKRMVPAIKAIHETEEGRPIETLWDVTVAATAHARQCRTTTRGSRSNALPANC